MNAPSEKHSILVDEDELHALQLAISDQMLMFARITLDPATRIDDDIDPDTGLTTYDMAKDILNKYVRCLDACDVSNEGLVEDWNKHYEVMKIQIKDIEDVNNVIEVDFNGEKGDSDVDEPTGQGE